MCGVIDRMDDDVVRHASALSAIRPGDYQSACDNDW